MKTSQRLALWLMHVARRIGGGAFIWSSTDITLNGKWGAIQSEGVLFVAGPVYVEGPSNG